MTEQQNAQLLPGLFDNIDEDQRVSVLHIGPALPETVDFFSHFRCKLYFVDLFAELPLVFEPGDEVSIEQQVEALLSFPVDTRFDLCLFWDIFNYLDAPGIGAVMGALRDHLGPQTLAHAFAVHNTRSPQRDLVFGIESETRVRIRSRPLRLPAYAPHPQGRLKELLSGFRVQRSVLLSDGRLELLLSASG